MRAGLTCLILAYVLSQFYRAILAVLTPALVQDLGMTSDDLAWASQLWFLGFAAMQLPVGWALDKLGPRRTAAPLLYAAAAGAALFATATGPMGVILGMALMGVGCAPALMATYYLYARAFPTAVFGTFAGAVSGLGALGNVAAALPFAWVVGELGWRSSMGALAALSLAIALACTALIRDPARAEGPQEGSILDLLRTPSLWPIFAMMAVCYYPAAALRDLWVGPYARDVFGAGAERIGWLTLAMGLAMGLGNFLYGQFDRFHDRRKAIILAGNLVCAAFLVALGLSPDPGEATAVALLVGIGLFGTSFPLILSYGKGRLPKPLLGRGVTLLNFFGIGATALAQVSTGEIFAAMPHDPAAARFAPVFLFFGLTLLAGLAAYALGRDRSR